ncbi:MAG: ATP-binding protein [Clostridiales bacterium]|jgi:predicted AAA+ superfamily ATPase|nr:ATP-binding protein [Clostridiales bacterium]
MYVKRHCEEIVKTAAEMYTSVIITGPRQVGKTTVLREMFPEYQFVSFDDEDVKLYASNNKNLFFKTYEPPVILDEVQRSPEIFPYIKLYADKTHRKGAIFMTGSQAFHLMKNASESLAGRVGIIDLLGLSLREISAKDFKLPFLPTDDFLAESRKHKETLTYRELWDFIRRGSLPEVNSQEMNDTKWLQYYRNYVRTYLERDVRALTQIGDEKAFMDFMRLVASNTSQMLNYSKIAAEIGKTTATVQNWISILETSGIVYLLKPYSNNFNKRIVKTPKIYFLDTGLCCFLTGWYSTEQLMFGAMSGAMYETFVIGEIIKSHQNAGRDTSLAFSYYRDKEQREIDLIIEENGTLYPIEIKKTASPNSADVKHFNVLSNETTKKIAGGGLIYSGDVEIYLKENTKAIPIMLI